MDAPLFAVAPEVFERFPDYVVGCVIARGIVNVPPIAGVESVLDAAERSVARELPGSDLKLLPQVAAWRDAFARCGWTPSRYQASVEALLRRAHKGPLPRINPIVDLANAAVLRHRVPIGAHDATSLRDGTLRVRITCEGDVFLPMGDAPDETPEPGEIVYASGGHVRTRRWVWRQGRDALVTATTRDVFFPIDGFDAVSRPAVEAAMAFLATTASSVLRADVVFGIVTRESPVFPRGS